MIDHRQPSSSGQRDMDASTAVWLGLTLAAPLTLVPEIALLRLLHSRRSSWHPLDVLLVSLVVGQLCCTLVALGLSAAALARHAGLPLGHADAPHHGEAPLCAALVSFWAAAHTLHAATLTSMAVDRAMTVRWPYKYRLSVRRTQVRYHVVVLAVVSVLVGVAALFASTGGRPAALLAATPPPRPSVVEEIDETSTTDLANGTEAAAATMAPERQMMDPLDLSCTFLPHLFDSRFSYFWMCLHGLLLAGALSAGAVVLVTRVVASCCSGDLLGLAAGSGSDMRTLGHASDGSSATLPLPGPARYTPGPCLGGSSVSPAARSAKPMFGSPDKSFPAHQHEESAPKKADPAPGRRWNRQRHSTVAAVLVVAYLTHHLPLMVSAGPFQYFTFDACYRAASLPLNCRAAPSIESVIYRGIARTTVATFIVRATFTLLFVIRVAFAGLRSPFDGATVATADRTSGVFSVLSSRTVLVARPAPAVGRVRRLRSSDGFIDRCRELGFPRVGRPAKVPLFHAPFARGWDSDAAEILVDIACRASLWEKKGPLPLSSVTECRKSSVFCLPAECALISWNFSSSRLLSVASAIGEEKTWMTPSCGSRSRKLSIPAETDRVT